MRAYHDQDPLHGHGKAMPHPKQPTRHTYRGGGQSISVDRFQVDRVRNSRMAAKEKSQNKRMSVASIINAVVLLCRRLPRKF